MQQKDWSEFLILIFTVVYAVYMHIMSNLIIADFDNPQVASAVNPSAFGYYYGKYILCICLYTAHKPYRSDSKS